VEGLNWQSGDLVESKVSIGTFVLVQGDSELLLGKVIGRDGPCWTAQRWRARNTSSQGLRKRFFPAWTKDGQVVTSAHPPRGSMTETFRFTLNHLLCSGFTLFSSMPDELVTDFARRRGLTVHLTSRTDGTESRTIEE
jgi:hypothetical protein